MISVAIRLANCSVAAIIGIAINQQGLYTPSVLGSGSFKSELGEKLISGVSIRKFLLI